MLRVSSRRKVTRVAALTAMGVVSSLTPSLRAANGTWINVGTGDGWNVGTNWTSGVIPGTPNATLTSANTDIATFNAATGVTVQLDQGNESIGSIVFSNSITTSGYSLGNASSSNVLILTGGGSILDSATGSGTQTFAAPVSITGAYTINDTAVANTLLFSNSITDASLLTITGAAATSGSSTVNITGSLANFTGTMNISTGAYDRVYINGTAAAPTSATFNIGTSSSSASTLYTNRSYGSAVAFNLYGAGSSENYGALRLDTGATVAGPVTLETNSTIGSGSGIGTISGAIGGVGTSGVTFEGGATVVLSGTNTYTGSSTVSAITGAITVTVTGNESATTGGWYVNPAGTSTSTATTLNFNAGSSIAVASTAGVQVGILAGAGDTGAQTLNVSGTVNNAGSLQTGRSGFININSGGVFNQSGSTVAFIAQGGYGGTVTIASGGALNYTGTSPIQITPGSSGSELLVVGGTLTTGQGFYDTEASDSGGVSTLNFSGGTLVASSSIASLISTAGTGFGMTLGAAGGTINTGANTVGIAAVINGTGNLTKTGSGILNLSGTNTFTGNTNVSAGTINLQGGLALQSSSLINGTVTFDPVNISHLFSIGSLSGSFGLALTDTAGNPVALTIGGSTTAAASTGNLSGSGSLTKVGTGVQSLSGSNTYTGTTTIAGGTLEFLNESSLYNDNTSAWTASNITVASGATLELLAGGTGQFTGSDVGTLLTNLQNNGGNTGMQAGSTLLVVGSLTVPGTLTLPGGASMAVTGTLNASGVTFNNSGGLNITATGTSSLGALSVNAGEATLTSTYNTSGNTAVGFSTYTRLPGGTTNFVVSGGTNGTTNQITISGASAGFIDQGSFFNGSGYAYVDPTGYLRAISYGTDPNSSTTAAGASLTSIPYAQFTGAITAQTTAQFETLNDAGAYNMALGSSVTVSTDGILKSGAGTGTISGGTGITTNTSGGEMVVRTNLSTDILAISSPILNNGGNSLTKSGAGYLNVSGGSANTYTGLTTVNAGYLVNADATTSNSFQNSSGIVVNNGGTLYQFRTNAGSAITETVGNPTTTLNGGSTLLTASSLGSVTFAFNNNFIINGNVTISAAGPGSYSNFITSAGSFSGTGTILYSASGASQAAGERSLTLNGSGSGYSGNWIASGTNTDSTANLIAGAAGSLGTGTVLLNGYSALTSGVSSGLNSLSGVNINSANAVLTGPIGWSNSSAVVSMSAGTFNVGTAASSAGGISIGSLNQSGGAINLFSNATAVNPLTLAGSYNYAAGSIAVTFSANPTASSYTLVNYTGTLSGDPAISTANFPGYTVSYGTGTNSSITLVENNAQSNLVWTGIIPSNWDVGVTANFANSSNGAAQVFRNNDNVTFDDTASSFTPTVPSGVSVYPNTITFNNTTNAYTLGGAGTIAGLGTLTMNGGGLLTINSTNSFTGGVLLNAGTVSVPLLAASGTNSPLGSAGTITFNGGTLNYTGAGSNTSNRAIALSAGGGTINVSSGVGTIVQSGVASGTGTLTKTGPGTLTMSGASTYTGGTVISSGTAVASVSNSGTTSGAFGSNAGSITLGNANTGSSPILFNVSSGIAVSNPIVVSSAPTGILAINAIGTAADTVSGAMTLNQNLTVNNLNTNYSSSTYTGTYLSSTAVSLGFTSSVSGTGGLTFNGTSGYTTDVYTGTNTYVGPTIVTGSGLLEYGNSVSTDPNSQLNISSASTVVLDILGSGKIGGLVGSGFFQASSGGTSVLSLGSANDPNDVYTGTITGAFTLTKVGTGSQTFTGPNTYTGSTIVTAGTLTGTGSTPFGAAANALTVSNTNTTGAGTPVVVNLSTTSPTTTGTLSGTISTPTSGTNTAVINNGGQLLTVNATASATYAGSINGSGGLTYNNGSTLTLSGNNTFTGLFTINQATVNLSGNDSAMTGGFLIGATTLGNAKLNVSAGAIVNVAAGNSIQVGPLTTGANAYTQGLNVAGILNNAGSLALGYVNTDTVLSGGVLNQSGPATLQPYGNYSSALTINSGGTLNYSASSPFQLNASTGTGTATLNISGLVTTGEGFQQSNPSTTGYGAYLILNGGTIALTNSVPQLTIGSYAFNVQLSTGGGTINTNGFTTAIGDVVSGVNSSSGGLVITGPGGSLTMSAANTYAGGTTISSGTAIAGHTNSGTISGAFGPSTSMIDLGDANTGSSSVTLQLNNGDSVLNPIVVSNLPTGAITIAAVGTTTNETLGGAITLNQSITINNTNSSFPPSTFNGSALSYVSLLVSGSSSGVGGITFTGGETTDVYSGTNNYSGPTLVTGGSLVQFGNSVSTNPNSVLNISTGSTVVTGNLTAGKFGGLIGGGIFQGATGTNVVSIGYLNDASDNFSGTLAGSLTLTKVGTGTQILSGSSVNTGTTTVAAGTLAAGAVNALSPNATFNVSGGTLDVSAYNNSIAALTVGAAGTVNLGIGQVLSVTGAASLNGTLDLVSGTVSSLPDILISYSSETGTFATTIGVPAGDTLLYSPSALEIVSAGPSTLNWTNASGNNQWDIGTSANFNTPTGATVTYSDTSNAALGAGDVVAFTDNNGGAGNYNVSINTVVHPTSTTINNNAGTYTFSGTGGISGPGPLVKLGTSGLVLNTVNSYTGGTNISSGTVTLGVAGALPSGTNLSIGSTAVVFAANLGNAAALTVGTLSVLGQLDLNNNALVAHNATLTGITQLVQNGYNSGAWNGSAGIISSAAANDSNHLTTLGVIVNDNGSGAPLYGVSGAIASTFAGASPVDGDILVKYTYYGDADLNGEVDGSDYSRIDNGFLNNLTGWFNGDFNYDGVINGSDYTLIDNAFNTQGAVIAAEFASSAAIATDEIAPSGGASAVPEPTMLSVLGLGAVGLLGRRRRRTR